MKQWLFIMILIGLLALGAWQMGYIGKKTEAKQEEIKRETKEETKNEVPQVTEADKAKVEAEAKTKAEADSKAQSEKVKAETDKLKAEADAKIEELKKQYAEKKESFMEMSQQKKKLETALKDVDYSSVENIDVIKSYSVKAQDINSKMEDIKRRIFEYEKIVKKSKNDIIHANGMISGQRDKSDRIGWKYVSGGEIHPMSTYKNRDRKQPVKVIYKEEDSRRQELVKIANIELEKSNKKVEELKKIFIDLQKQYIDNKTQYKIELQNKINKLSGEMKSAKDEGKKLDDEIDKLKQD